MRSASLHQVVKACCQRITTPSQWRWITSTSSESPNTSSPLANLSTSRAVVKLTGPGALDFLQGMVTNDTHLLKQDGQHILYAALLTPKGRFLHDIFIHLPKGDTDFCLLDVDVASKQAVTNLLNRYKLRRPLQIADASSEYAVWVEVGPSTSGSESGWALDPRLSSLGRRAVVGLSEQPQTSGGDAGSTLQSGAAVYRRWRIGLGVPEGDSEIPSGKAQPLEYNLDALHGLSFTKGCYVGQERQSFTHFRGVIRRRLMPCRLQHTAGEEGVLSDAEVVVEEGGEVKEVVGSIRAAAGDVALAYLRLAAALDPSVTLKVKGSGVEVYPYVPDFWPAEFSQVEEPPGPN